MAVLDFNPMVRAARGAERDGSDGCDADTCVRSAPFDEQLKDILAMVYSAHATLDVLMSEKTETYAEPVGCANSIWQLRDQVEALGVRLSDVLTRVGRL